MADDDTTGQADVQDAGGDSYFEWTITLVRLLAVWMLATGVVVTSTTLASIGAMMSRSFQGTAVGIIYPALVSAICEFIVAALLWRNAARIANAMWRDREPGKTTTRFDAPVLQRVVRQGIGLWLIAHAAAGLPSGLVDYARYRAAEATFSVSPPWGRLAGAVVELVIGVWLFVGTTRIAGWLRGLREVR